MKVKCINIYNLHLTLTIGKIYDVINKDDNWYWIINDSGDEHGYPKGWFRPLSEIRNEIIDKLLSDES